MRDKVEGYDFVTCQICGKQGKALIKHLKVHTISVEDYKDIYKTEIECENSKQLRVINRKNTIIERYGVENVSQLPEVKEKIANTFKETCLEKYGVTNIRKLPEKISQIQSKRSKTMIEKYGTDQMIHIPEANRKMRNSIKALWDDPNSIYNSDNYGKFSNITPNKVEQIVLDYGFENVKFTGNFSHWITFKDGRRKNPDFVITPFSITKKVIEVFGGKNFYHTEKEAYYIIRSYEEVGVKCLLIWDFEIANKKDQSKYKIIVEDFINS